MNLCKDICKRCVDTYAKQNYTKTVLAEMKFLWDANDDWNWEAGNVQCPHGPTEQLAWAVIEVDSVPTTCIHKFEHAIAAVTINAK